MSSTQRRALFLTLRFVRAGCVAALFALLGLFVCKTMQAQTSAHLAELGAALSPLIEQSQQDPRPRTIRVNGLTFAVGSQTHLSTVDATLDAISIRCPGYSAKGGDANYGFAVCMEGTFDLRKPESILSTLRHWISTRSLSPAKTVFVLAKRWHENESFVLSLENEGGDFIAAFSGEAPSSGVVHRVPGPQLAKQLLSLGEDGQPYDVSIWSSRGSVTQVAGAHVQELRLLGYEVHDLRDGGPASNHRALVATGTDLFAVLSVIDDNKGGVLTAIATSTAQAESERVRVLTEGVP